MEAPKQIYQLKVTLEDIRPPIWRRIEVAGDTPLAKLHRILQTAFGWHNSHLHAFGVGETTYGAPHPDFDDGGMKNERRFKLCDIAPDVKSKFRYEYDFGDGWLHLAQVEKIFDAAPDGVYPLCIKGKRACPPEDCGGPPGYDLFLEAIADPEHEEHNDLLEWVGGAFDPEAFDQNAVNQALRRLR